MWFQPPSATKSLKLLLLHCVQTVLQVQAF
jgi:hypothetical protein